MRNIFAATDLSSRSDRALRRAGLLARQFEAKLTIAHIVEEDQPSAIVEAEKRDAERYLTEQMQSLAELRNVDYKILVTAGDSFDGILRVSQSTSADLIVMGAHRKQLLRDVFVGTTIERVIRLGSRPVLMVNREAKHPYKHALAAIDVSEASAYALSVGRSLGLLDTINVTIAHAFTATGKMTLYVGNASQKDIDKYVTDEAERARSELVSFLDKAQFTDRPWSYSIAEGDPYEVIVQTAKQTEADLVLIGTHGRSGISKLLLGSVAEQILRRLDTDILAVPPPRAG